MVVVTASVMAPEWATPMSFGGSSTGRQSSALTFGINAGTTPPCQPQSPGTFRFQKSRTMHGSPRPLQATESSLRTGQPPNPISRILPHSNHTFSCTGPIRLDIDGNGSFDAARDYAAKLLAETPVDMATNQPDLQHREISGPVRRSSCSPDPGNTRKQRH